MSLHTDHNDFGNPLGILGNTRLLQRLTKDVSESRLSHAYILDGKPGSGRHTVARHVAAAIACYHREGRQIPAAQDGQFGFFDDDPIPVPETHLPIPCGACEGCRKVLEGISPDVHVIGREGKATLGVDAIRRVRESLYISPVELDTKIYVIEDAETMTPQAQNALLLSLEEPPPYVLFLLLCNGTEHLLETILSRAPVLKTQPMSDGEIRSYLQSNRRTLPASDMEAVLIGADGSIGQALTLSDSKSLKDILRQRGLIDAFIKGCAHKKKNTLTEAVSQFGSKREEVLRLLSLLSLAVRDLLLVKKAETVRLKYYTQIEAAAELADTFTTRSLLSLYTAVESAKDDITQNRNIRLTLTHMCLSAGVL
ncbi:MAG: hypothetical protein J6D87_05715 [Clostridia bacterium]|nr:hypothetical protein [Clostridia bacterium]